MRSRSFVYLPLAAGLKPADPSASDLLSAMGAETATWPDDTPAGLGELRRLISRGVEFVLPEREPTTSAAARRALDAGGMRPP